MTLRRISSVDDIKGFYNDPEVVGKYLEKRTAQPLNSVLHKLQVTFIKQVIESCSVMRVLDLAPGPARLSAEFNSPPLAVALDFSPNMLREARRRIVDCGQRWHLVQGDGYHLPFATESFDLVYSVRFIRRFDRPQRDKLYAEIKRALRPEGFFIMDAQNRLVALPHRMSLGLERYPIYDELFLRDELVRELEENGFRVKQVEGMMRCFALQRWLNRLRRYRLSGLARVIIRALEYTNDRNPSTWMVLCQKKSTASATDVDVMTRGCRTLRFHGKGHITTPS
jgi:ubiquinone/menaquinone biosynthesis C-methylase UbiE